MADKFEAAKESALATQNNAIAAAKASCDDAWKIAQDLKTTNDNANQVSCDSEHGFLDTEKVMIEAINGKVEALLSKFKGYKTVEEEEEAEKKAEEAEKAKAVGLSGGNDGNAKNLQACIGECDDDGQCAAGLECYQRSHGEAIPGCTGSGQEKNWDYCYDPVGRIELSGGNDGNAKNLQACIGECDDDGQCAPGLKCSQRENGETIPGCKGAGGGKNWDYCYNPLEQS